MRPEDIRQLYAEESAATDEESRESQQRARTDPDEASGDGSSISPETTMPAGAATPDEGADGSTAGPGEGIPQ